MEFTLESSRPEDTYTIGEQIGCLATEGTVICLTGDLGAGKTLLTQGIAKGLVVPGLVNSPTFTIVCEYAGRLPLYHMDLYRLDYPEMLADIGFEEYLSGDGVTVIEWAERAGSFLPRDILWIRIEKGSDGEPEKRWLRLTGQGEKHVHILKGLKAYAGFGDGHGNKNGQHRSGRKE